MRASASRRWAAAMGGAALMLAAACSAADGGASDSTSSTSPSTPASTSTTTSTTTTTTTTTVATTTTTAPALRKPTPQEPLRVVIMGDSTAYAIGWGIVRANDGLLAPLVEFETSSGLVRDDFFDWQSHAPKYLEENPAEVVLISLGANDHQPITTEDGAILEVDTGEWRSEYRKRVGRILDRITSTGAVVYWLGQPMSRHAGYNAAMSAVNELVRAEIEDRPEVTYISVWRLVSDDGHYTDTLPGPDGEPVQVRMPDGIHLTDAGGDIAAAKILEVLRERWGS